MNPPLIFGPMPPFNNLPIESQFYQPSRFVISNVALGITTIVTTTLDMNYVIGQEIRLIIPTQNGCRQLNEQTGFVISIPSSNQVEININSLGGDPFVSATGQVLPQILAIGDVNTGNTISTGQLSTMAELAPPGSFINISPL